MANNPHEAPADDFLEQILGLPNFAPSETGLAGPDGGMAGTAAAPMFLQLSSGDGTGHLGGIGGGAFPGQVFPLGLSLDQGKGGFLKPDEASGSSKRFRDEVVDGRASSMKNLRRERIAERIRALQELVPSVNKVMKGGPFLHPTVVIVNDSLNPCLLQHHLRNPNPICPIFVFFFFEVFDISRFWCCCSSSPREVSLVLVVPIQQRQPYLLGVAFAKQIFHVRYLFFLFNRHCFLRVSAFGVLRH